MLYAALSEFLTSFSLILAVGAQNAFVIRQGLIGEHVLWLCLFCSVSDMILIAAGVYGFGALVELTPELTRYLTLAGASFLVCYGALRFRAAWIGEYEFSAGVASRTLAGTLALAAAFTWANPHVYLDTVALVGTVSTGFPGEARPYFAAGAMLASFVFFFSLGYGARLLAPVMRSPQAWRVLDTGIGVTMWWLAGALLLLG